MDAAALLRVTKKPTDADIDAAMTGNVCRCAPTSASGLPSRTPQGARVRRPHDRDIQYAFRRPRRDFLKAGAGLTLGVILAPNVFAQAARSEAAGGEVVATAALEPTRSCASAPTTPSPSS
jgi:hypothetical protein